MDSSNMVHLDKKVNELPQIVMQRVQEKIRLGLKATEKFLVEMTIQSLFDQRAFLAKFVHTLNTPQRYLGAPIYADEEGKQ